MDTLTTTALLTPRALFSHNSSQTSTTDSSGHHVCISQDVPGPTIIPFIGNMTYHTFSVILSGSCALFSALIILFVIFRHATNYTAPVQQRQIIRILFLVPWVSLWSWLVVLNEGAGDYLVEALDFGCAMALSAFLLLMCDFVLEREEGAQELFGKDGVSPLWLKRTWYGVLQFIPTSLLIWLGTIIALATGRYCKASNNIHFAHIWITALKLIVTTVAILCVLRFYGRNKPCLRAHGVVLKLFAFKSIIGLNVVQTFIISILAGHSTLHPTHYLTYHDIDTGLPSLLLACEMPIFSILLLIAFPVAPYRSAYQSVSMSVSASASVSASVSALPAGRMEKGGVFRALREALDVRDLLGAFWRGPMRLLREQRRGLVGGEALGVGGEAAFGKEGH